ncbi:hypothetical protein L596_009675 [Steinernema carpocapsae]|uniref:Uncharacterized protein n=1 Tax=Steinernema carpocapsae TaxID=34508 RepID=A0A4V6A6Q1_STECR|nr:hypothetical protein L596_009675 [Steinernema carpocapsae]
MVLPITEINLDTHFGRGRIRHERIITRQKSSSTSAFPDIFRQFDHLLSTTCLILPISALLEQHLNRLGPEQRHDPRPHLRLLREAGELSKINHLGI